MIKELNMDLKKVNVEEVFDEEKFNKSIEDLSEICKYLASIGVLTCRMELSILQEKTEIGLLFSPNCSAVEHFLVNEQPNTEPGSTSGSERHTIKKKDLELVFYTFE